MIQLSVTSPVCRSYTSYSIQVPLPQKKKQLCSEFYFISELFLSIYHVLIKKEKAHRYTWLTLVAPKVNRHPYSKHTLPSLKCCSLIVTSVFGWNNGWRVLTFRQIGHFDLFGSAASSPSTMETLATEQAHM